MRVDFSLVALEDVQPTEAVVVRDGGAVEVPLECPATFGTSGWAAGTLVVSEHVGTWLVDRIQPVVSGEQ